MQAWRDSSLTGINGKTAINFTTTGSSSFYSAFPQLLHKEVKAIHAIKAQLMLLMYKASFNYIIPRIDRLRSCYSLCYVISGYT